jgi:tetratricopeptide (TPR) repeat protein
MCVTIPVIEALQRAYFSGHALGRVIPGVDADTAAIIVAETLEADRIHNLPPRRLFSGKEDLSPMTDFKRAALAELFFLTSELARDELDDWEKAAYWSALALAILQECAESPIASPLLWYEDIYAELGFAARGSKFERGDNEEALSWFKHGLAHSLTHNEGDNALGFLRDLAETYLIAGDLDTGLGMLAALLRHAPADIWTYNVMAISFDAYGLTVLGAEAARRGLALIDARKVEADLRQQLTDCLAGMKRAERHGREAEVSEAVLREMRAALALDFDAEQPYPIEELCRELVPELDSIVVKRPMTPEDLPLPPAPTRQRRRKEKQLPAPSPPVEKPGRNDPCWCGSGKKYKRCHWREDRR